MDTRTGKIYPLVDGMTLEQLSKKLNAEDGDLVMLDKLPEGTCRKCRGTGSIRAGLFSRRFKPCRCTKAGWAKDRP